MALFRALRAFSTPVAGGSINCVCGTIGDTGHALDALGLVDNGRFLLLPRDGVRRAFFEADAALDAFFLIHLEFEKRRAAFGGTGLVNDVGLILIPEVLEGRKHRVGSGLSQAAQGFGLMIAD